MGQWIMILSQCLASLRRPKISANITKFFSFKYIRNIPWHKHIILSLNIFEDLVQEFIQKLGKVYIQKNGKISRNSNL